MKHNHYAPGKVNPHLPHDGVEIEVKPQDTDSARAEADLLVSQLLHGNTKPAQPAAPKRPAAVAPKPMSAEPQKPAAEPIVAARPAVSETQPVAEAPAAPVAPKATKEPVEFRDEVIVTQDLREAFPRLSENDHAAPTFFDRFPPVYFVALGCGVIVFLKPALLFWMLVSVFVGLVALAALAKIPGVAHLTGRQWQRFANRAPDRAEGVRKVADRAAMMLERILDLLPGSLADRLSLPDFSQPVAPKR